MRFGSRDLRTQWIDGLRLSEHIVTCVHHANRAIPNRKLATSDRDCEIDRSAGDTIGAGAKLFWRINSPDTKKKSLSFLIGPPNVKPGCSTVVSPTSSGPGIAENCFASVADASRPKA